MDTQEISKNVNDISLEPAAAQGQNKLCEIWPTVKEGLELLKDFIKNPIVKSTIAVIIAAGDAIVKKVCK